MRKMRKMALLLLLTALPAAAAEKMAVLKLEETFLIAGDGTRIGAEAGELRVPENRAEPGSRLISLRFVRLRSTAAKPGSPIVYLAGGPGGSGIAAARGARLPLFLALREIGHVIALDQRGTGLGLGDDAETDCDETVEVYPGQPLERGRFGAAAAAAARRCAERLEREGFDLRGYTTRESAADLEDLRLALGAEKISLWGISYGSHLAFAALRRTRCIWSSTAPGMATRCCSPRQRFSRRC